MPDTTDVAGARDLLDSIFGYAPDAGPVAKLGKVATLTGAGGPRILFDGETIVGQKVYPFIAAYVPVIGDRVVLVPVGTTFLILGKVTTTAGGDFRIAGTASGLVMQSPNGTYWRLTPSDSGASVWTTV